ncbi:prophage tail fiber N-terminal domain-containing protein [Escherichia coli]|uniref:prophage tail fiber N-terminal domain-containing protein n=1 Tax=Escherichia coli TaxID=562 RepID=UPI00352AEEEF
MAVKISGVLKDGTGKPVENCTIQLKARRTSSTVVVNTVASENPDEAGRYSMDVEYGQYSVILWHRKTGRELHHSTESQTDQQHGGGEHGGL